MATRKVNKAANFAANFSMSGPDQYAVFFERTGSYRRWPYICFCVLFGVAGLIPLAATVRKALLGLLVLDEPLGIAVGTVWLLAMLGIAGFLAYRLILNPNLYSRIDGAGITVENRTWLWNDVYRVWGERASNGVTLYFQPKRFSPNQAIHGWPLLPDDEALTILESLEDFLNRSYSRSRFLMEEMAEDWALLSRWRT